MFGNFMREFEDDPFFSGMPRSDFDSLMSFPARGIVGREDQQRNSDRRVQRSDPFQDIFQSMNRMMSHMHTNMDKIEGNPNVHSFSSSSVMSYHNDGKSKPKMMQASKSTRLAPGQIRETRRSYRDSESGIEKMAIGHHIGSKGHVMEKRRQQGGPVEEERRFLEMNEDDIDGFEREWKSKTSSYPIPPNNRRAVGQGRTYDRTRHHRHQDRDARGHHHAARPVGPSKSGRLKM
ncbi:myeloid leukemia factor 1-like [Clavelina lepadiformis]|uniref:myeloid leukemia factor 1-like n=1 Tax=Clavelina lepadiformis TaxID=159417 RepID=UPI0040422129